MWASTSDGGWSLNRSPLRLAFVAALALFFAPGSKAQAQDHGSLPSKTPTVIRLLPPPEPAPASSLPSVEPGANLTPFLGHAISDAQVIVDGEPWGYAHLPVIASVRAGESMSAEVARRALNEVLRTGYFARARVFVVDSGGGRCKLVVAVVARKIIDTLRVELNGAKVERDELLHQAELAEGGELVGAELADKQDRMESFLARHGYPAATISLTTRGTDDPVRISVLLDVHPGEPRKIERVVFYVNDADPSDLKTSINGYRVVSRDRADEAALDSADNGLEAKLRSKGYRDANVSHDVVLSDGAVVLRVRVDAGTFFLPRFTGNDHFDSDALTAALSIDTDTDFTPQHLADKLRDFYRKHGYLDVEVTTSERGGPRDRTHYVVFSIIEHRRVGVSSRAYPCLKEAEIKNLTQGGPSSAAKVGVEIDSYLEEELPGADLVVGPNPWVVDTMIGGSSSVSRRAVPTDLDPDTTYVADTYERAIGHVQELYRNEGYLHAQVGPVQSLRQRCSRHSRPGKCDPDPFPPLPAQVCTYDATNLPLPVPAVDSAFTCTPDPAHGVECAPSMSLRIPIKLGPRTTVYDVTFTGVRSLNELVLAKAADVKLGGYANSLKLEEARRRVLDVYKEEGYAYADVRFFLDESLDHTRARARFEVVEGEQVIVQSIIINGNDHTREGVIRRRIALEVHKPYRTSDVKKTQERIATLNVFTSVNVSLADPYVPQKNKTVIISVSEPLPEHVEVRPGFSTGEGFRITNEYGNQNILGTAIGFSARLQLSYLPDALIVDRDVAANYRALEQKKGLISRIAGRLTIRTEFPEIGLGPLFRMSVDALYLRSLQRDFTITKFAGIPTLNFRPIRELQFSVSQTAEYNQVTIFSKQTVDEYLQSSAANADIRRFLRVPDGDSEAFAQRLLVTWDRRDNSFNAHGGTNFVSGIEHVDWYLTNPITHISTFDASAATPIEGHFVRMTQTFAGYIPIGKKIVLAAEIRSGLNVQTASNSATYPDRLFFMGGFDSMRGWTLDSFIPQDYVDKIRADAGKADTDPSKFTAAKIAVRGGNLMINPKIELRIPITGPFETVLFGDIGNLWADPLYALSHAFSMRVSVGTGLRFQTPVGTVAVDYGINLTRYINPTAFHELEDFGALQFAIGLF